MSRIPPRRPPAEDPRGPRETKRLPDRPDARRTWTGPPRDRSPRRWSGTIDFGGRKHNVGTFDTPRQWGEARDALIVRLREERDAAASGRPIPGRSELDGVTIADFVDRDGTYQWPWEFTGKGARKRTVEGTFDHHAQCIRALRQKYGDRPLKDGISRKEARDWAHDATENQVTSAIAMFNDANDIDETVISPFQKMSRQRTRGRSDLPDVLAEEELDELVAIALFLNPGPWGEVLAAMIETEGTTAPRPGELWAFEYDRLRPDRAEIYIEHAVKKTGKLGPPKWNQKRWVVIAPRALERILRLERIDERFILPSKTGKLIYSSLWTTYWHPVRDAFTARLPREHWLVQRIADCAAAKLAEPDPRKRARMPDGKLDFYELRHRAITYMGTPRPHGLGLASPDIALQVGHRDGGRLIEAVYMHRNAELARDRIRAAMGYDNPT